MSDDNGNKFYLTDEEDEQLAYERNELLEKTMSMGTSESGGGPPRPRMPPSDRLAGLANENIPLLFKDQHDIAHAVIQIKNHFEIAQIESGRFKRYLSRLYYDNEHQVIKSESITNVVHVIQAKAEYEGPIIPLALRVTWDSRGNILYDLTNEIWQYVRISRDGWNIVNNETPNPIFCRYKQIAQITPQRNYEPDIFDRFLQLTNLKNYNDRILLKVYIITLFVPEIPHVINVLHGGQGSAKSTLQNFIKLLVDPAKPKLLTVYGDVKEFIQQLAHNYVAYYDNLKKAPGWLSDEACKAVTGVGSTKRKLYSDDDDIVYEYMRCLGFSGINAALTEPDALDRSIMTELMRIKPEDRKDEKVIMSQFLELRPRLLGYIFDILVKALQIKDSIILHDLPRMADSALWGEAIARAMGYKELEFLNAYYENIGKQNTEAIENHPLGQVIVRYITDYEICEGSASEVLDKLEIYAIEKNVKTDHRLWPKAANSLTRRLNQISSNLLDGPGIDVQITRITDSKDKYNTSSIKIAKISPVSPVSPGSENHEGKQAKLPGGIEVPGDIIPPVDQIPPVVNAENRAQNEVTGGP
jgi:hypothetical protein